MAPYQTLIIAEIDSVIFCEVNITMVTGKQCKNTPYFYCSCSYKLKRIIQSKFRATLNNWKFKVALNPLWSMFLSFAESFILACWSLLCNKTLGSLSLFFRYEQLKFIWDVFEGLSCCHSNFLLHKNDRIGNNWCLIWYQNIAIEW